MDDDTIGQFIFIRLMNIAPSNEKEARMLPHDSLSFMVDVKQIELPRAAMEMFRNSIEKPPKHRRSEGIKKKGNAGIVRKAELCGILQDNFYRTLRPTGPLPPLQISFRYSDQLGIQLDPNYLLEVEFRCEQEGASHTRAEIDEAVSLYWKVWLGLPPAMHQSPKDRRSHSVVGGGVAIMWVPRSQMFARHESAGLNIKLRIEGMLKIPFLDPQSWQETLPAH